MIAFSLTLGLIAAVLSGLAPALQASKPDVVAALKDDAQAPVDRLRLRNAFVIAQVAFSTLLVVITAVLVHGLDHVTSIDRGFDARGVDVAVDRSVHGGVHVDLRGRDSFATCWSASVRCQVSTPQRRRTARPGRGQ